MSRAKWGLVVVCLLVACESEDMPTDGAVADGGTPEGGLDGSADDGGVVVDDERPSTLSPLACQTDLEVLREEDFGIERHPLDHKGEIFGFRIDGTDVLLLELASGRELARSGQMVPGFGDQLLILTPTDIAVAPDLGLDNDPDYPIAFDAFMDATGDVLFRSDTAGGLVKVLAEGETIRIRNGDGSIEGIVDSFGKIRVSRNGTVSFVLRLEGSRDLYLVQERGPGAGLRLAVGVGTALNDTLSVGTIEDYDIVAGTPLVRVGVRAGMTQVGFAYLRSEGGEQQCVLTDTPRATDTLPGGLERNPLAVA